MTTVGLTPIQLLGPDPAYVHCPWCGKEGPTSIQRPPGLLTWLAAGVICVVGGVFGCCLVPFCVDGAKDVRHYCGSCQQLLHTYERI